MSLDAYREEMKSIQQQMDEIDRDPHMSPAAKAWTKLQLQHALENLQRLIKESE
jgi:hypothetical protein